VHEEEYTLECMATCDYVWVRGGGQNFLEMISSFSEIGLK
jgi:hypothetical protein